MIELYSKEEWEEGRRKKSKMKKILIAVIVIGILLNVAVFTVKCIVVKWGESYFWYLFANCALTILLGVFLLLYCGIPYRLCRNYMKLLDTVVKADPRVVEGIFLGMEPEPVDKDGIEYYNLMFHEGRDRKGRDIIERILLDVTREMPDFEIGDKVAYTAPSKIISSYEVLEKHVLDEKAIDDMMNVLNERIGLDAEIETEEVADSRLETAEKTKD